MLLLSYGIVYYYHHYHNYYYQKTRDLFTYSDIKQKETKSAFFPQKTNNNRAQIVLST